MPAAISSHDILRHTAKHAFMSRLACALLLPPRITSVVLSVSRHNGTPW